MIVLATSVIDPRYAGQAVHPGPPTLLARPVAASRDPKGRDKELF